MSSELIALVVALTLGSAVVILGLRRNLSETTRKGLPQFGGDPERAIATVGLYEGGQRPRRPLSPRQRHWLASFYLLIALTDVTLAVISADNRLLHASTAGLWALGALVLILRKSPHPAGRSTS